jgi:hypothetical protein
MANKLHDFLSACFTQAADVIGEEFTLGAQTDLIGIFTAVDGTLDMQIAGYQVEADYSFVADKAQFNSRPRESGTVIYQNAKYQIVGVSEDLSAYKVDLKLIAKLPNPPVGLTWGTKTGTWGTATGTWGNPA